MKANGLIALAAIVLAACATPVPSHAEKVSAPVDVAFDAAPNAKSGDVVTTTVRVTPTQDATLLTVTFAPYKGVELVSGTGPFTFSAVKAGTEQTLSVQVRLTDPEQGYLSVFVSTEFSGGKMSKAALIPYGTAGPATLQKLHSGNVTVTPEGERLIEMPVTPTVVK